MARLSTVITVGLVTSLSFVGPVVKGTDDRGNHGDWQLQKVRIAVENVIKGTVNGSFVDFYFYMWLGGTVGDWNALHTGDRCVFFLESDEGVLRAIRDFERSSIEIGTGRHDLLLGASIKERVSKLLFTLGEDFQPARFLRLLPRAISVTDQWMGACETLTSLKLWLGNSDKKIADAVKERVQGYLADGDPCLR